MIPIDRKFYALLEKYPNVLRVEQATSISTQHSMKKAANATIITSPDGSENKRVRYEYLDSIESLEECCTLEAIERVVYAVDLRLWIERIPNFYMGKGYHDISIEGEVTRSVVDKPYTLTADRYFANDDIIVAKSFVIFNNSDQFMFVDYIDFMENTAFVKNKPFYFFEKSLEMNYDQATLTMCKGMGIIYFSKETNMDYNNINLMKLMGFSIVKTGFLENNASSTDITAQIRHIHKLYDGVNL